LISIRNQRRGNILFGKVLMSQLAEESGTARDPSVQALLNTGYFCFNRTMPLITENRIVKKL